MKPAVILVFNIIFLYKEYFEAALFYRTIFIFLSAFKTWAYIPPPDMVLSRLGRHQGRGDYHISQRVYFLETSRFTDSFQLIEKWYKKPQQALVHITSPEHPQLQIYFLYENKTKKWINSDNKRVSKSGHYIESYFFQENPVWLNQAAALDLGRALGVVNYVFSLGGRKLWVEQDEFLSRKVQFSPGKILNLYDYQSFSSGLWLPKRRVFTSSDYKVNFELLYVRPLPKGGLKKLKPNDWETPVSNRDIDLVRRFYQEFR